MTRYLSGPAALCLAAVLSGCGGGASTTPYAGPLTLEAFGGPAGSVAAEASVYEPGVGQQRTCAPATNAGACQLTSCQVGGVGSPRRGYGDFGPIAAIVGTTTVPLTYGGFGYGTVVFPESVALGTGGVMKFHGGNWGAVPAFDVAAIIPDIAVITSPAPAANGDAPTIDTSQDLTVTWVPISIGRVQFHLQGGSSDIGGIALSVACFFDGASGAGVVPQTLLSTLKEMSGTSPTSAYLDAGLEATTVVDGLTIVTTSGQSSAPLTHYFDVSLQ